MKQVLSSIERALSMTYDPLYCYVKMDCHLYFGPSEYCVDYCRWRCSNDRYPSAPSKVVLWQQQRCRNAMATYRVHFTSLVTLSTILIVCMCLL